MAKQSANLDGLLRAATRESGLSILQVAKRSGCPYAVTHRFMTGGGSISLLTASKLLDGLGLVAEIRTKKVKG